MQPWAQRAIDMVRALGGASEASVISQPWQTDISRAALANGFLIGAFECEPLTGSHASGTVLQPPWPYTSANIVTERRFSPP